MLSPFCTFGSGNGVFMIFVLLCQCHPQGSVLCGITILTLAPDFIICSDSGSMVVDFLSNSGLEAHWIQRVYWSWTEGGKAIALFLLGRMMPPGISRQHRSQRVSRVLGSAIQGAASKAASPARVGGLSYLLWEVTDGTDWDGVKALRAAGGDGMLVAFPCWVGMSC